jgi:hypothetical protein
VQQQHDGEGAMIRRGLRVSVALALSCLSAAGAHAAALGDNMVRLAPSPFKLPQNLGPLRYAGENRYSDRRMGRAFTYNASGISLKIYVYDFGLRGTPDGPNSVAACEQFESAKREIERGGNYENVIPRGEFSRSMGEAPTSPLAREAVYEFDRNGIHAVSVLWVTVAKGYFLKLRLSLRAEVADELEEAREVILGSIAAALPPREAETVPAAPMQEASIDVQPTSDSASVAAWLAYAIELTRFSGDHPDTRPPCGGLLEPGFAAELAARQAALREYRTSAGAALTSSYFNELARVDDAGFLDEYVWHYLRNDRWDLTPPAGLDLDAFEPFRERELAAHAVQSGARVRINAVRPLPAPPAR